MICGGSKEKALAAGSFLMVLKLQAVIGGFNILDF